VILWVDDGTVPFCGVGGGRGKSQGGLIDGYRMNGPRRGFADEWSRTKDLSGWETVRQETLMIRATSRGSADQ
jgi:hypothetical protein